MAVRTFLRNAGSRVVSVTFRKEDGSLRTMQFNPRDRQEIKGTGAATITKAHALALAA